LEAPGSLTRGRVVYLLKSGMHRVNHRDKVLKGLMPGNSKDEYDYYL